MSHTLPAVGGTPRILLATLTAVLLSGAMSAAPAAEPAAPPAPDSSAASPAAPDPATQLPGVTVEGKKNPLEESDRRLRELLEKSTPCIGCDAKKPNVPRSLVGKILDTATDLITPQTSKPLDHDGQGDGQREVDRADYERRHPVNGSP